MQKEYKTILNDAVVEYEEKKSRFIASVKPILAEEEAIEFVHSLKTKYWDATHNVYSYYICGNNIIQRFSDDGEPSGTAGMPVLEVIKRLGVQNLVVVVTRYFGGTLLGAAGLIRAYSKSALLAIEAAKVVTKVLCVVGNIVVEYTLFGKVQNELLSKGYTIKSIEYGQDVEIKVYTPMGQEEKMTELITEITNARAIVDYYEKEYITI